MSQGGARAGAGRKPGGMNRMAKEAREKASATGLLPHEFLLAVMRGQAIYREEVDPDTGEILQVRETYGFEQRIDCGKAAAPYFAPKISTVEVISGVPDDELDSIIAKLAAEAGLDLGAGGAGEAQEEEAAPRRRVRLEP